MQDFISKGNGDSRYLKSVSNFMELYPTYEDFVQALVEGTLPIDFNGYNPNGISQRGTPYNKASVLTDATASLFGLDGSATVNQVLSLIGNGGFGGGSGGYYAVCETGPNVADKAITLDNFELEEGAKVTVFFRYGNSEAVSPYLAINNLYYYPISAPAWGQSTVLTLTFVQLPREQAKWYAESQPYFSAMVDYGIYTGNGKYGKSLENNTTIPARGNVRLGVIMRMDTSGDYCLIGNRRFVSHANNNIYSGECAVDTGGDYAVHLYSDNAAAQMNINGERYSYAFVDGFYA